MKLAICCPIYNCLNYTKEFIESIRTKHPYRVIIFDNGSSDGSFEWLTYDESIKEKNITVLHSDTNLGISKGANNAMREAIKDPEVTHILYANNDIIFRAETIDMLVWCWDNRQDEKMVKISAVDIREGNYKSYQEGLEDVMKRDISQKKLIYGGSYTCFIWDKQAIEKVGLLDENVDYYDDNIHAEEILRRGFYATTLVTALIYHRGSGTIKGNQKEKQYFDLKSEKDRKYAFNFFGVDTQLGIREKTERGRPIWTPQIEKINEILRLKKTFVMKALGEN